MKIDHIEVFNIKGAIRGMRNPLGSNHLSDSFVSNDLDFIIGPIDLDLAKRLISSGKDHRKFIRQIFVSCDISAPEYWWKQYHTYKVSTTENSTSQMHTMGKRPLVREDFELEDEISCFDSILSEINKLIVEWVETKDKIVWRKIIQMLPQSFIYKKTCTLTYETLLTLCQSRKNHKLKEWDFFIDTMFRNCPYLKEFVVYRSTV